MSIVRIEESWRQHLSKEFEKAYFQTLSQFVKEEYATQKVFPHPKNIFRAFDMVPFEKVNVVIMGQDPYHGEGQASGMCFAVSERVRQPPSLQNIFKEIQSDLGEVHADATLESWVQQGVLLLNATLTVRANSAGSHQGKGWEQFTDAAIDVLNREREQLVFILWGNYAKQKGARIDRTKHLVIESAHPSPFSAYSGFFGSKPFSKTNTYLTEHGKQPIEW